MCLIVAAVAAVSLVACGSSGSSTSGGSAASSGGGGGGRGNAKEGVTNTSITLGTTNVLTGPAASTCKPISDGAQAWFKSINDQGGVNGRKINDDVENDQYTAPNALKNVRSFISKPVFAVFGGCGSIQPPAIAPVLKSAGVPYLFPTGSIPGLATDGNTYLAYPLFQRIFPSFIQHEMQQHGPGSLFAIVQRLPGSDQTTKVIQQATQAAGGKYIGSDSPLATQTDWNADALKIKQGHADYVVFVLGAGQTAAAVNTMVAQNALPTKEILGNTTEAAAAFLNAVGNKVNGKMVVPAPTVAPSAAGAATCVTAMKKYAPGIAIDTSTLFGCASAQVFTTAIQALGSNVTRAAFTQELQSWRNKQASPALPPLTYTANDHSGVSTFSVLAIQNGQLNQDATLNLGP